MVDMNLGHHSKVHKGQGGLTIKPPVGYDLCADVSISHLLSIFRHLCLNSILNVKVLTGL